MKKHSLSVVADRADGPARDDRTQVALERAEDLKARARSLARDQLAGVQHLLDELTYLAGAVARSGDDLSPGVREVCRQVANEAQYRSKSLGAIVDRTSV